MRAEGKEERRHLPLISSVLAAVVSCGHEEGKQNNPVSALPCFPAERVREDTSEEVRREWGRKSDGETNSKKKGMRQRERGG